MLGKGLIVAVVALVGGAGGQGLSAQRASGFAGAWLMEYPARISNENGVETVEAGHAHMMLLQRGDSLTGEWRGVEPGPDGKPVPPRIMRGKVSGTHASLETTAQAHVNRNGEESTISLTVRYELELAGDGVTGTQAVATSDGTPLGGPREVSGKREEPGAAGS